MKRFFSSGDSVADFFSLSGHPLHVRHRSGKILGQEGIASLERAFLLAGARGVIASLWPADDTFTIALMKRMYQHLADGADKGAALRQAKLDLLKEFGDQALPIYWAGFTLVGDAPL